MIVRTKWVQRIVGWGADKLIVLFDLIFRCVVYGELAICYVFRHKSLRNRKYYNQYSYNMIMISYTFLIMKENVKIWLVFIKEEYVLDILDSILICFYNKCKSRLQILEKRGSLSPKSSFQKYSYCHTDRVHYLRPGIHWS